MFILEKSIIPAPKQILNSDRSVKIARIGKGDFTIENCSCETLSKEGESWLVNDIFKRICATPAETGYKITIKVDGADNAFAGLTTDEAYYINASEDGAVLCGKTEKGAFYACITFTKMLYVEGDEMKLALAHILDYPDYADRGHFIETRYGSDFMTKEDWIQAIDYFADMKINVLNINLYNCWSMQYDGERVEYLYVPVKAYPELKTPKTKKHYSVKTDTWHYEPKVLPQMVVEDSFGEIVAYGKKRNVKIAPGIATFGHNTLIPRIFPEVAPCRENPNEVRWDGMDPTQNRSGFCTSNPKTYEILFAIMDEIIDRYLLPNGATTFEIGLDEIMPSDECQCENCKNKTKKEIIAAHLLTLVKHLKEKGMTRVVVCHDMLMKYDFFTEEMRQMFIDNGLYDALYVKWWTYEDEPCFFWGEQDKVNNMFHSWMQGMTGYYHWIIPTDNNDNIRICAKFGKDLQHEGIVSYTGIDKCFDKNYLTLADVAWNIENADNMDEFDERYAYRYYPENTARAITALRTMYTIMKDDQRKTYRNRICGFFDYYFYSYISNSKEFPQNFPGRAFDLIKQDEAQYIPYLEFVKEKATSGLEFFETNGSVSEMNKIWTLTAMQYKVVPDEYLTLYNLYKQYNAGLTDGYAVLRELDRLIIQRERLMALAEEIRIPANSYTYLRNMGIVRQYMIDLRAYFRSEMKAGRKPMYEVSDLRYAGSETLDFYR